jgi:hypothetical protein
LLGIPAPAYDQWFEFILQVWTAVEKSGAFRRQHPFMTVSGIKVCTDCLEIELDLPGRMSSIDEGQNAGVSRFLNDRFDRKSG